MKAEYLQNLQYVGLELRHGYKLEFSEVVTWGLDKQKELFKTIQKNEAHRRARERMYEWEFFQALRIYKHINNI